MSRQGSCELRLLTEDAGVMRDVLRAAGLPQVAECGNMKCSEVDAHCGVAMLRAQHGTGFLLPLPNAKRVHLTHRAESEAEHNSA